jgi:hypothetical protein
VHGSTVSTDFGDCVGELSALVDEPLLNERFCNSELAILCTVNLVFLTSELIDSDGITGVITSKLRSDAVPWEYEVGLDGDFDWVVSIGPYTLEDGKSETDVSFESVLSGTSIESAEVENPFFTTFSSFP